MLIIISLLISVSSFSQKWNWIKSDFTQKMPDQYMACDDNNGVYLCYDDLLIKYDTSGVLQWQLTLGTLTVSAMEGTKDGVVISGNYLGVLSFGQFSISQGPQDQMIILYFDGKGKLQWHYSPTGPGRAFCEDLTVDLNENIAFTGYCSDSLEFSGYSVTKSNYIFAQIDKQGVLKQLHAAQAVKALGKKVRSDSLGNYYVFGECGQSTTFNPTLTINGGTLGTTFILLKYDQSFNLIWGQNLGTSFKLSSGKMNKDRGTKHTYLTLISNYSCNVYRYDEYGTLRDSFSPGIANYSFWISRILTNSNDVYFMGYLSFEGKFCSYTIPEGMYLLSQSVDKNCQWVVNATGPQGAIPYGLAVKGENIYTSGWYGKQLLIADTVYTSPDTTRTYATYAGKLSVPRKTTDLIEQKNNPVSLQFPNPVLSNEITISLKSSASCSKHKIELFDTFGQIVANGFLDNQTCSCTIVLNNVNPGTYYLRCSDSQETTFKKILILK